MVKALKEQYQPIIDATEFGIEHSSSLVSLLTTFSVYKNKNIVKVLIGIMPSGAIVFKYEGSVSDKKWLNSVGCWISLKLVIRSWLTKSLTSKICLHHGGAEHSTTFKVREPILCSDDVLHTKKIAELS